MLLLEQATQALQRLLAQIELQAQMAEIGDLRPLSERSQLRPLLLPLKNARERGVQASIIESADRLVQAVDAETALAECSVHCDGLTMPELEAGGELMSAESGAAHTGRAHSASGCHSTP